MNVSLPAAKQVHGIKIVPDEMVVKMTATKSHQRKEDTLKSEFEEKMQELRKGNKITKSKYKKERLPSIECPILTQYPAVIQTLLQLVWETHARRFHCISTAFEQSLQTKIANTHSLQALRSSLLSLRTNLLQTIQEECMNESKQEFQEEWMESIELARKEFQVQSYDIHELVQAAVEKLRIQHVPTPNFTEQALHAVVKGSKERMETLWKHWEKEKERNYQIFQGNLQESLQPSVCDSIQTVSKEVAPKDDAVLPSTDQVQTLTLIQMDFEIRKSALQRVVEHVRDLLMESEQQQLADATIQILAKENSEILQSRKTIDSVLHQAQQERDKVIKELKIASGRHFNDLGITLKAMESSVDLCLEMSRSVFWNNGIVDLQ